MEQGLGAVLSPIDVRDYQLVCSSSASYPTSFELENMPEVKSQGLVSSCVAHALATIIEYLFRGAETSIVFFASSSTIVGSSSTIVSRTLSSLFCGSV